MYDKYRMSSAIEIPQSHRCELAMTSIDVTRGGVFKQIAGGGGGGGGLQTQRYSSEKSKQCGVPSQR